MKKISTSFKLQMWAIGIIVAIIALLIGGLAIYNQGHKAGQSQAVTKVDVDIKTILPISEVNSLTIYYDKTVDANTPGKAFFFFNDNDRDLYIYKFVAKVGYDAKKIKQKLSKNDTHLTVTVPKMQVNSTELLSYKYYSIKSSVWISKSKEDGLKNQKKAKKEVNQNILATKVIKKETQASFKSFVTGMYGNMIEKKNIHFVFE
ncbi:MAG: DUF4230 domain-containing protein [Lactobacillaceae bacterium]|jgi:hypothetical protein|nr:DUF4230 domain-containing protein [Lactobacillaceae bacterium]